MEDGASSFGYTMPAPASILEGPQDILGPVYIPQPKPLSPKLFQAVKAMQKIFPDQQMKAGKWSIERVSEAQLASHPVPHPNTSPPVGGSGKGQGDYGGMPIEEEDPDATLT